VEAKLNIFFLVSQNFSQFFQKLGRRWVSKSECETMGLLEAVILGGMMNDVESLRLQRQLLELLLERMDFGGPDAQRYLLDLSIGRIVKDLKLRGLLVSHILSALPTPREFRAMRAGGANGLELKRIMRRAVMPVVESLLTIGGDIEFSGFGGIYDE